MTILQLTYFLKIYETGSYTAAAEDLFVTRSALSKSLRELESELGGALFERTPSGLAVTTAGKALRDKALEMLSIYEETKSTVRQVLEERAGTVTLGVTPATTITVFPRLYRGFSAKYPDITLLPVEGGNSKVQNMLETGQMDACITTYSEKFPDSKGRLKMSADLRSTVLEQTELVLCVSKDHRLASAASASIEDIEKEKFVFMKRPIQREAELSSRFARAGKEINILTRTSQSLTLKALVASGLAISLQPKGMIDDGTEVIGVPLDPPAPYVNVLVWNEKCRAKESTDLFIKYCLEQSAL